MRPLRAMATQVELGSSLTSLASIREPRTEAVFRHSFLTSLSDSSRKPGEGPRALALLIPEGRGNPMGPATMPSTASRPPWTPKPFSRETSSDTFATVKPPVPALKPSHATPKPPTFAQTFEDTAKGAPGNIPPLLDQKPMESRGPLEPVAHLPFYLSPQANTVILFESRGPAKGRAEEGGSKAQEGQLLRSQSEKWPRRQPSLSTDPRPDSWAPRWKEAFAGGPKGPATQQSPAPATETHSQVGGRPAASAGFGRSWQEQRQPAPPEAASGPGSPKPKPLPLDLTGIFEPREPSWQKKPSLAESGEKSFPAAGDGALEATGARSAAASSSGAAPSGPRAKSTGQLAESPQGCLPSAPPGQTLPEEAGRKGAQEETVAWEPGKPSVGQPSASQGQPLGERAEVPPQQGGLRNASDGNHRGCAKKTLLLPDPPGNPWAPTESESLRGSPGQETGTLNIQQRIQVLTAEKAGAKTGGLRRSFRSRPLSTDLTQMFSGPVAAGELKAKPGWNRKPARERQEAPEEETLPVGGADGGEAGMAGSPWKPPLLARTPSGEEPPKRVASVPGEDPSMVLSPKARTLSSSSTEDSCPKTVRATMFEYHVQRHSVVASQIGPEPALVPPRVPFGGSPSCAQEFWKERMLGDGWVAKASVQKANASEEARGLRDPRPLTEDKGSPTWAEDPLGEKGEQPASKGMEDSLLAQRIEPRYEILQTVGERAQSEAVAAVSGGKAVTLRRQRYLKENRRAGGYGEAWGGASPPGRGPFKDHPASRIQAAFYSEATGPERNRAGQQAASSKMKDDGNFAPLLETEKERGLAPAGVTEGSKALGCTPQWAGARAPGADGWEGGAGVLDQQTSRGQNASGPGFLFGLHLKPPQGPEDSEGQERRSTRSGAAQEKWEATAEGKQPPELNIGARWASSFRDASAPRGSDRWRRKTLPHGSARLEEAPQGPAQLASRRGTPRPAEEGSAAKGSSQTPCGPEPRQPEKPLSPSEPKATYFAVTCQISEINNPPRAAAAPHASACRRASPFSEGGSSPARPLSRRRGDTGASDHLETGASQAPPTQAGEQEQEPQRQPEASAAGRPARADPLLSPGPRSPSYLAPLQPESQQKRSGALGLGVEEGEEEEEAPRHYRSRVVDIDELMAEYGGDSRKPRAWEGRRENSFFPWEKSPPRSSLSGKPPCSADQGEKTRGEHSLGSKGPGTEGSRAPGSHPREIHPQESRAREGKCSPPQWGKPPDAEKKPQPWSAGPSAPKTKTPFLAGGEQGGGTWQSARDPSAPPARVDPGGLWKEASLKQWAALAPTGGWSPNSDWGGGKTGGRGEPQAGVWETGPPAAQPGAERSSATASPGSPPDKAHRGPARLSFPSGARLDQSSVCQRFSPERPGGWLSKGGPSPGDCSSHGGTRGLGEGGLRVDRDDATAAKRSPFPVSQRRSHSFYNERRTDHWPGGHLKQCFGRPSAAEARDTDVLVQEADRSLTPESPSSSEGSEAPAQKPPPSRPASLHSTQRAPAADQRGSSREQRSHSLDNSSHLQAEPASPTTEKDSPDFSFLEQTPRLDCGVLKSRVLLGKKLQQHRAPISHTLRRGASGDPQPAPIAAGEGAASAWMFRDCTEEKPPRAGEEEEESPPAERPFPSQPRLPLFPGLAPSALKAQLRKRPESEGRREEAPPAPLCKSPKGPFPARVSGGRALAATPKKEGRPEELPPAWLTELKSRREQGQPESPI
ncbi:uncharacterized protein KIAA1671 homolog [Thamnophis elegans]|uniref:uncharacterized protein KIAA1671 homolog n=1 Tax=Thamnophis elegans TaxID=35005 RepID=UPI001378AACB|nr:uncharacterized protein KIAA1671 homolog [Thamnophis elegans]